MIRREFFTLAAIRRHVRRPSRKQLQYAIGIWVLFSLIWLLALCVLWSREPARFDPNALPGNDMNAPGVSTVTTLMELVNILLEKPGGYMSNDRISPAIFLDNMPNWEYGAVLQIRDAVHGLRQDFSRSRAQSIERPELVEAEARFNISHQAWMMPSTEEGFREGVAFLEQYKQTLLDANDDTIAFVQRQDVLDAWLHRQQRRLGSLTVRLRANVDDYQYNPEILTSYEDEEAERISQTTPRTERDDIFYEARGSIYVMYHMMRALRNDFKDVLNDNKSMGSYNRALSELHAACAPLRSPFVMNGKEFGIYPNHSLTLAAHAAKAHLAIVDLRMLLRGGGDL